MPSARSLLWTEAQTTLSRIWTWIHDSVSVDDNRYAKRTVSSFCVSIFTNPSARAGYDTRSISLPYYLPIAGGRIIGLIPFPRVFVKCNQPRPGFEFVSPCPFPTTITITSREPPVSVYLTISQNTTATRQVPFSVKTSLKYKWLFDVRLYSSVAGLSFSLLFHYLHLPICLPVHLSICLSVCLLVPSLPLSVSSVSFIHFIRPVTLAGSVNR